MKFIWDGSFIGEINEYIISYEIIENYVRLNFKDNLSAYVFKYENSVPLIADEIKPLFGIIKIGRHSATWNGKKVLLSKIEGSESLLEGTNDIQFEDIQKSYIYRWCLGLTSFGDNILKVRTYKSGIKRVTSYVETEYNYDPKNKYCSKITKSVIIKWYISQDLIGI